MLFNSLEFTLFLPIVFILYWFVTNKNLRLQNTLLLFASYLFYGWWDWRFLSLILFSTCIDYVIGLNLGKDLDIAERKWLLWASIGINIGLLGIFKYYNFFVESFAQAFSLLGTSFDPTRLNIILPIGISFYTFQTLSYSIDIYRRKLKPTKDFIAFAAFVSFFPQLVAGPIERATNLLPQFQKQRGFDYDKAVDGMRQILWGLFKKIVIADNAGEFVDLIFATPTVYNGSTLFLGAIFFSLQIYCDFSGYSDIAIGVARLFGFNLKQNFAFPYFSRDIAEFWRRWHISLSTWFRDYLYIPLGGSKVGKLKVIRNVFLVFIISGLWHGANWTFIFWGLLNAIYYLPLLLLKRNRKHLDIVSLNRFLPTLRETIAMLITYLLVVVSWIFFRAENIVNANQFLSGIFSSSFFQRPNVESKNIDIAILLFLSFFFILIEWSGRKEKFAIANLENNFIFFSRWVFYCLLVLLIFTFSGREQQFIYSQF